ncbi:MAG: hypothetical protein DRQ47_08750 [Gammaproteobacteria bacterium]|nr:MAG: hypothetical protein DRQ47_08750 [Gammaproteobacteria bacterium]
MAEKNSGINKTIFYLGKLPARVLQVFVADDEEINKGDPVCVVETPEGIIKIRAPESGTIQYAFCEAGDELSKSEILIVMNEKKSSPPSTPQQNEQPSDNQDDDAEEEEDVSATINFFANVAATMFFGTVLFVIMGFVTLYFADRVFLIKISQDQEGLSSDITPYWQEDEFFGMAALYSSLTWFQADEEDLAPVTIQEMENMEPYETMVLNTSDGMIYNSIHTYGDLTLPENNLEFEIPPSQHQVITYYYPSHVGCNNPPPARSPEPLLSWTTESYSCD